MDIEANCRFKASLGNKSFLKKIFTDRELAYCFGKRKAEQHLAARYAAKEAAYKAVTDLLRRKVVLDLRDIEIINDRNGAPKAKIKSAQFKNTVLNVSLSHCDDRAIAFVVALRKRVQV